MYELDMRYGTGPSPAVLAAALSVGLMRRPEHLGIRALMIKVVTMPLIALSAAFVGLALLRAPVLGAAIFCAGIGLSIWLRNFGPRASAVGRAISLPLLTILAVPVRLDPNVSPIVSAALVLIAGAVALILTSAALSIAERLGVTWEIPEAKIKRAQREGVMPIATRMALQMLAALVLAFGVGMSLFPAHWPWVVLTAFIVCSGTLGRGDAIYKALLRFGGAVAGTLAASLVALAVFPNPQTYAGTVFFILFLGIWLRSINYAYWAACATLIFALLQNVHGAGALPLFAERVFGIVAGALCAIAATWFVYPIRTEQLVRRRIADALAALRDTLTGNAAHPNHEARVASLRHHAAQLERVAPPVRLHRALFGAKADPEHPATLIDRTRDLLTQAETPEFDRAHVGAQLRRLATILRGDSKP
ncbi:MAG TPA: FUSC family protein [Candidatus Baltobacteraceae bacterium]|nr:FUSC family protein [Candidatus Baltobacteraceae bacterium]